MRPTPRPAGRGPESSVTMSSISFSTSSASLYPEAPKNLMPLYSEGLCEAEMTAPASAPRSVVRKATDGVVHTPSRTASPPAEQMPEVRAASRNSPEARVSLPTAMCGRLTPVSASAVTAARPRRQASWAESSRLAIPRTPSVPNSLPMIRLSYGHPHVPPEVRRPCRRLGAGFQYDEHPRGTAGQGIAGVRGHPGPAEGRERGTLPDGAGGCLGARSFGGPGAPDPAGGRLGRWGAQGMSPGGGRSSRARRLTAW